MSSSDSEKPETQHGKSYVHRLEAQLEEATRRINELTSLINDRGISAAKEPSGPDNRQTEQPSSDRNDRQRQGSVVQEAIADGSSEERHRPEPAPLALHLLQQAHSLPCFALGGTTSLSDYLRRFEQHCRTAYAGSFDDALPMLRSLLTGEMVDIFDACGGTETPYERLKQRMLCWFEKQDSAGCQTAKQRFDSCKRRQSESLSLFALRLSSIFEDAYPSTDIQTSKLLRDRLLDNLPPQAAEHLKKQERYNKAIHGITMKWDNYVTILQCEKFEDDTNSSLFFSRETRPLQSADRSKSSSSRVSDQTGSPQCGRHRSTFCKGCRRGLQDDSSSSEDDFDRRSSKQKEKKARKEAGREQRSPDRGNRQGSMKTCKFCHRRGHIEGDCWRKKGLCFRCGQSGHFVRDCRSRHSEEDSSYRDLSPHRSFGEGSRRGRMLSTRSCSMRRPSRRAAVSDVCRGSSTERPRSQECDSGGISRGGSRIDPAGHPPVDHEKNPCHLSEN